MTDMQYLKEFYAANHLAWIAGGALMAFFGFVSGIFLNDLRFLIMMVAGFGLGAMGYHAFKLAGKMTFEREWRNIDDI